ncbi:imelysin family protein, partial [Vibrio parahaemolyticus V-223/04]
HYPRRTCQ